MAIIKAENVSIRYITGDFKDIGLKEYITKKLKGDYKITEFWADRNISFELEKGDMLGIIGTNGAGKSTLLKAVSGIMVPTEGKMTVKGNIAALLELASGFDGDLTVRENTYLRGAMLGYTRDFMNEMYDQIIDFAELNDFQQRPFKQLSSGMKSRLAFSIACLVSPDILILDEVLSVGDGSFKSKSANKMREILDSGVTGILVSHSLSQVREMCNKILWLDHGKQVAFTDETELYLDAYEEFLATKQLPQSREDVEELATAFSIRKSELLKKKERTETQRLQAILEAGDSDAAIQAALNIIKKSKPELLNRRKKVTKKPTPADSYKRISAKDKYDMSIKMADQLKDHWAIEKFECVVLTDGEVYANALSGAYLAKINKAPLLFVNPEGVSQSIEYVTQTLKENGKAYVVGKVTGFTDEIFKNTIDCSVEIIKGNNIYDINLNSLKCIGIGSDKILVCTGEGFADSISAIATGLPIIIVSETLSDSQIDFINTQKGKTLYILGGINAVNETIEEELKQYANVERICGNTRYETSALIANEFFKSPESVVFTSGKILDDGFCSGVYASHIGSPMFIIDRWKTDAAKNYVRWNKIKTGIVIGSEDLIGNNTANIIFKNDVDSTQNN